MLLLSGHVVMMDTARRSDADPMNILPGNNSMEDWYMCMLTLLIVALSILTISFPLSSYYNSSSVCLCVCVCVCSLSPQRSFDGSSPNLVAVCRWTSHLPLRGSFSKRSTAWWVNGSLSLSTILYMRQPHATCCKRLLLLCWLCCRV